MYERILKNIEIRGWKTYKSQINLMHEIECKKCGKGMYLARTGVGTKKVSKVDDGYDNHEVVCQK
jgi:hypothetical protein